jgi:hypothetical protein
MDPTDDAPTLSPFDTLEETFRLLSDGPRPIALDGSAIAGLPDREIPVRELRAMLLHPSVAFSVRDAPRARRTGPGRRRPLDRWPRRRPAARVAPGDLAAVRSVPPKARRARIRGAHRVSGRARPLPAGARPDRVVAVLADPGRGGPAASCRAGRAGRARHRPGARRPAPAVGPSRLRLGQGRRRRGDRSRRRRPDLLDAPRAPEPRRGRQEARDLLQGVPAPACEGRGDLGRVHRIRLVLPVRFC